MHTCRSGSTREVLKGGCGLRRKLLGWQRVDQQAQLADGGLQTCSHVTVECCSPARLARMQHELHASGSLSTYCDACQSTPPLSGMHRVTSNNTYRR